MAGILDRATEPYRYSLQSTYNTFISTHFSSSFQAEILFAFTTGIILYWILGFIYLLLDLTQKPTSLYRYKIQPTSPKNQLFASGSISRFFKQILANQLLMTFIFLTYIWLKHLPNSGLLHPEIPTISRLIFELICIALIEEALFYYSHRLLHSPLLYRAIHKVHHEWQSPIALEALYCHPVEHLFSNMLPVLAGPILLNSHNLVLYFWITVAITNTLNAHSGYAFPWNVTSPVFHDYHHLQFTNNFGVLGLLDWLHGTDQAFKASKYFALHQKGWSFFDEHNQEMVD